MLAGWKGVDASSAVSATSAIEDLIAATVKDFVTCISARTFIYFPFSYDFITGSIIIICIGHPFICFSHLRLASFTTYVLRGPPFMPPFLRVNQFE